VRWRFAGGLQRRSSYRRLTLSTASKRKSWQAFALDPAPGLAGVDLEHAMFKLKDALLRRRFIDRQIAVAYHYLNGTTHYRSRPRFS
jgi:hypothetical protein